MKPIEILGSNVPALASEDMVEMTVDISRIPFLLNAAGIRVLYHRPEDNHKVNSSANYTVSAINPDGSETPLNFVRSIKFELDVDEDEPLITVKYIDYPPKG